MDAQEQERSESETTAWLQDRGRGGSSRDNVRPLSRATGRPCARSGCPAPAQATLTLRYDSREVLLDALVSESVPATYDLCLAHAERTRPPRGWDLQDRRSRTDAADTGAADRGAGTDTVAVLAAALRGEERPDTGADGAPETPDHRPDHPPDNPTDQPTDGGAGPPPRPAGAQPAGPRAVLAVRSSSEGPASEAPASEAPASEGPAAAPDGAGAREQAPSPGAARSSGPAEPPAGEGEPAPADEAAEDEDPVAAESADGDEADGAARAW